MDKPRGVKWSEKTPKEKLDFVFVCIAIVTFSLMIVRFRKKRAIKKGVEYKPLFPKTKEKMELVKLSLIKKKQNEKVI